MFTNNVILSSDSYKYSMYKQYPEGTERVYSYVESRGGKFDEMVFLGVTPFIQQYLTKPITMADIDEAEELILAHGEPFNREGWEYILREHDGYLPVEIKALPEGTKVGHKIVLLTISNTDEKVPWITTFLETALLRSIWYPTTVAANSLASKKIIQHWLEKTGDPSLINFKLHDFGARGVSSSESAALGGIGHLVNFDGTDTVEALWAARKFYGAKMAGFSIPAAEHSTITSWGRDNEVEAYRNMVKQFSKPGAIYAVVSDSYDIYRAVSELWGRELKAEVIAGGGTLVVRPDSGNPAEVVTDVLNRLADAFGYTINEKGYKVLNHVRVIQGDGITSQTIQAICFSASMSGFSTDNITFGQGGALLQGVDRDSLKFAMKCSAAKINGKWVDVYKDPIDDKGKTSKKGLVTTYRNADGDLVNGVLDWMEPALVIHYRKGENEDPIYISPLWEDVVARARA